MLLSKTRCALTRFPSQSTKFPYSVPHTTFPSGSSAKPVTSDRSNAPNFPISPWSFKPVKV